MRRVALCHLNLTAVYAREVSMLVLLYKWMERAYRRTRKRSHPSSLIRLFMSSTPQPMSTCTGKVWRGRTAGRHATVQALFRDHALHALHVQSAPSHGDIMVQGLLPSPARYSGHFLPSRRRCGHQHCRSPSLSSVIDEFLGDLRLLYILGARLTMAS